MTSSTRRIRHYIESNDFLAFGLGQRLFNLSKLAGFITEELYSDDEIKPRKEAVVMQLSRLSQDLSTIQPSQQFMAEDIALHGNLVVHTYPMTSTLMARAHEVVTQARKQAAYSSMMQSPTEITLIIDRGFEKHITTAMRVTPSHIVGQATAISIRYPAHYADVPGSIYGIVQQLLLHNVNIVEAHTTHTTMTIYIARRDAERTFRVLAKRFLPY